MAVTPFYGQIQLAAAGSGGTSPGTNVAPANGFTLSSPSDVSQWVFQVEDPETGEEKDYTNMGGGGFYQALGGIKKAQIKISFFQDYAAAALDVILYSTLGGLNSLVYVDIKPSNASRSTTNPSRVYQVVLTQLTPMSAKVGDIPVMQVTWPVTGGFGRLTS